MPHLLDDLLLLNQEGTDNAAGTVWLDNLV
jgi:hypothetical protein